MLKKKSVRTFAVGMAAMVGVTGSVGYHCFWNDTASAEKFATKIDMRRKTAQKYLPVKWVKSIP